MIQLPLPDGLSGYGTVLSMSSQRDDNPNEARRGTLSVADIMAGRVAAQPKAPPRAVTKPRKIEPVTEGFIRRATPSSNPNEAARGTIYLGKPPDRLSLETRRRVSRLGGLARAGKRRRGRKRG